MSSGAAQGTTLKVGHDAEFYEVIMVTTKQSYLSQSQLGWGTVG